MMLLASNNYVRNQIHKHNCPLFNSVSAFIQASINVGKLQIMKTSCCFYLVQRRASKKIICLGCLFNLAHLKNTPTIQMKASLLYFSAEELMWNCYFVLFGGEQLLNTFTNLLSDRQKYTVSVASTYLAN